MILKAIFFTLLTTGLIYYFRYSFKSYILKSFKLPLKSLYILDLFFIITLALTLLRRFKLLVLNSELLPVLDIYLEVTYFFLGIMGLFLFFFICFDILKIIRRYFFKEQIRHVDESRRNFLKQKIVIGGAVLSGGATGLGFYSAYNPEVKKVNIPLLDKYKNLSGLRIAQISDIHIGPNLGKRFLEDVVEKVNKLNADVVVITGDLVDGHVEELASEILPIKDLKAKLGVFYITGNHEYYWGAREWVKLIKSYGIKTLINENETLTFNNEDFTLAGVTDQWAESYVGSHKSNPKSALKNSKESHYKILLAHRPKSCYEAAKLGYNLQLSSHTHGGQGFPFNLIVKLSQPYIRGLYKHEGMDLYVNAGTGFWGPPYRFLIRGEITEITLS